MEEIYSRITSFKSYSRRASGSEKKNNGIHNEGEGGRGDTREIPAPDSLKVAGKIITPLKYSSRSVRGLPPVGRPRLGQDLHKNSRKQSFLRQLPPRGRKVELNVSVPRNALLKYVEADRGPGDDRWEALFLHF